MKILNGEEYLHKDDKKVLKVEDLTYQPKDGTPTMIKGIMRELPKIPEYVAMIAAIIAEKNSKLPHYRKDLDHINLIIHDKENR